MSNIKARKIYTCNGIVVNSISSSIHKNYTPVWMIEDLEPDAFKELLQKLLDKCVGEYGWKDDEWDELNAILSQMEEQPALPTKELFDM